MQNIVDIVAAIICFTKIAQVKVDVVVAIVKILNLYIIL